MEHLIVWDAEGARKFENGVSKGVLFKQSSPGVYGDGVAWNGLTGVTESPSGAEFTDLYADDIQYASLQSAEKFGATVEAYTYPDEFAECDGSAEVVEGVFIGQQSRKRFGMAYRTLLHDDADPDTSDEYKLHLIYGAAAAPSEKPYASINDSPEAIAFSWELVTQPVAVPGYKPSASLVIDSTKVDPARLAALEAILYGTAATTEPEAAAIPARLPLPDEVITLMAPAG